MYNYYFMIKISDLTGIPNGKRKQAIECLDDLMIFKDSKGLLSPIITGYNWYVTFPKYSSIINFSNIHETDAYKEDMLKDLGRFGYDSQLILNHIREKGGYFLWKSSFEIRDQKGNLLPGLKIKDVRTKQRNKMLIWKLL